MSKISRDPVILPGMPGSSCQMHIQIVNDTMKSLKRKKKIDKSESTAINKYKFKAQQDALKEGISSYYQ